MSKRRKLTEFYTSSTKKSKSDAEQQISKSNAKNNDTQENLQYFPEIEGNKQFHPPETFQFPKRKFGSRDRSFNARWPKDFDWIHYDQK